MTLHLHTDLRNISTIQEQIYFQISYHPIPYHPTFHGISQFSFTPYLTQRLSQFIITPHLIRSLVFLYHTILIKSVFIYHPIFHYYLPSSLHILLLSSLITPQLIPIFPYHLIAYYYLPLSPHILLLSSLITSYLINIFPYHTKSYYYPPLSPNILLLSSLITPHLITGNPRKSAHSKIRPWAGSRKKSPKMRPWAGFLYLRGDTFRECPQ